MKAKQRYQHNAKFGGRKEKDGFVCSSATWKWFDCVAVKINGNGVQIRDTKDLSDVTLNYTRSEWNAFIKGVKAGEFDV